MIRKRLFISLIALVTMLTTMAETYKGYGYKISDEKAKITFYTDSLSQAGGVLEVPGYIPHNGKFYPTVIDGYLFNNCQWVTRVTVQYGCLSIGECAFSDCLNLGYIKIPASVKKVDHSFASLRTGYNRQTTLNIVYTGLELPEDDRFLVGRFIQTITTVATYPLQQKLKAKYPYQDVRVSPFIAFDYQINQHYYVITKTATANGNGESALVGAVDPALTIHPNSYRHTDYDATLNPVSYNCTLIPDSVFAGSNVESLSWTRASRLSTRTRIGEAAFRNCSKLTSVDVSCDVIDIDAFYECKALTNLTLEEGVDTIGERAFWYCPLKQGLLLPATLSFLEKETVTDKYDQYNESHYPGLNRIRDHYRQSSSHSGFGGPFTSCSNLEKYYVAEGNRYFAAENGILYDANKNLLISCPTNYQNVKPDIPKSVVAVGGGAFANITSKELKIIDFPYGTKFYGTWWFTRSNNVEYLHIPGSATPYATAGIGVFSRGEFCDAYKKDTKLKQLVTGITNPSVLGSSYYWPSSIDVVVPAGPHTSYSDGIYAYLTDDTYTYKKKDIQLGGYDVVVDGIPYLLTEATATREATARVCRGKFYEFDWTNSMKGVVTIPETIEYNGITYTVNAIDMQAFAGNTSITGINMPATITDLIGTTLSYKDSDQDGAQFKGCVLLSQPQLSPNIKAIPNNCFEGINARKIKMPWGVESIGNNAFNGCTLDTLLVPSSVGTWSANAFSGIKKLTCFIFNKPYDAGNPCFKATDFGSTSPEYMNVPSNSLSTYANTGTKWSDLFRMGNSYDFSETVRQFTVNADGKTVTYNYFVKGSNSETEENIDIIYNIKAHPTATDNYGREFTITGIGYRIFNGATHAVQLSDNITDIGDYAFEGYQSTTMTLPETVKSIGDYAFSNNRIRYFTAEMTQLPQLGTRVFQNTSNFATLRVPSAMLGRYKAAEQWRDFYKYEGGSNHYTLPIVIAGHRLSEDEDMAVFCDSLVNAGVMKEGGIITYDYRTNTLTLENVDLTSTYLRGAIYYDTTTGNVADLPETLTIVSSNSKLTNPTYFGMYVNRGKVLLKGDLEVFSGRTGGALRLGVNTTFELAAGASLTAEGKQYGISGAGVNSSTLIIGSDLAGDNAVIKAKGGSNTTQDISAQMLNGYDIVSPAGASFYNGHVGYGQYQDITGTWVTITKAAMPLRLLDTQIAGNWTAGKWNEFNDSLKTAGILNQEGRISYDYDTNTLTFDNVHIDFSHQVKAVVANGWSDESHPQYYENGLDGFKLKIVGDCSITARGSYNNGCDLFSFYNAGMSIEGDESATLTLNHENCLAEDFAFYGYDKNYFELLFNGPSVTSNGARYFVYAPSAKSPLFGVRFNYGTHTINLRGYRPFSNCSVSLNPSSEMNILEPRGAKFVKTSPSYADNLVDSSGNLILTGTVIIGEGTPFLLGDVNEDGTVNVGDVAEIYKIILGSDNTFEDNADVNDDDTINTGDISTLYELIVGNPQ